jgi:hypothetical protein
MLIADADKSIQIPMENEELRDARFDILVAA